VIEDHKRRENVEIKEFFSHKSLSKTLFLNGGDLLPEGELTSFTVHT